MIEVSVNNERKNLDENTSIADALPLWGFQCERIAVAVNTEFVPRSTYARRIIRDGDKIDVLAPVQGG